MARKWVMLGLMMMCLVLSLTEYGSAYAQMASRINAQPIGDMPCGLADQLNNAVYSNVVNGPNGTWPSESKLNHTINPGSSSNPFLDFMAACTGISLNGIGFTLPSIESIINAVINAIVARACSYARSEVAQLTSMFTSVLPCFDIRLQLPSFGGHGIGSGGCTHFTLGLNGSTPANAAPAAAGSSANQEKWSEIQSLFQADPSQSQPSTPGPSTPGPSTPGPSTPGPSTP